jgi:hypothetical protein
MAASISAWVGARRLHVQDAHDIVDVTAADREAGVTAFGNFPHDGLDRVFDRQPDGVGAGHHDGAHVAVGQAQNAVDHVALGMLENTGLGAFGNKRLHFLFRNRRFFARLDPEELQERFGRQAQEPDDRGCNHRKNRHRTRDEARNGFRVIERDALGDQFAYDQRQIGGDRNDDREGNRECAFFDEGDFAQHVCKRICECRAAVRTGDDAYERDSDLDGGQEARRVFGELECSAGAFAAVLGHLLEPDLAG